MSLHCAATGRDLPPALGDVGMKGQLGTLQLASPLRFGDSLQDRAISTMSILEMRKLRLREAKSCSPLNASQMWEIEPTGPNPRGGLGDTRRSEKQGFNDDVAGSGVWGVSTPRVITVGFLYFSMQVPPPVPRGCILWG